MRGFRLHFHGEPSARDGMADHDDPFEKLTPCEKFIHAPVDGLMEALQAGRWQPSRGLPVPRPKH